MISASRRGAAGWLDGLLTLLPGRRTFAAVRRRRYGRDSDKRGGDMRRFLVVAVSGVALACWATAASAVNNPRVFDLLDAPPGVDQPMGFSFEQPPVGGDRFGFHHTLYKWNGIRRGARVGHLQVVITFVTGFGPRFTHPALTLIDAQAFLPGGTVMVVGYGRISADGPSRLTLPVVGGTGIYANARGFIKVRDLGNGNNDRSNIEFHLLA
jgi:hypothetical protein